MYCQKQPSAGVLKKNCSEYMQQIYRRTTVSKCNFNKVSKGEDSLRNVSFRAFHEMRISRFHRVKLPGKVQDILSQPFHEIWIFWKSIFRISCTVKDFSIEFVFMLDWFFYCQWCLWKFKGKCKHEVKSKLKEVFRILEAGTGGVLWKTCS